MNIQEINHHRLFKFLIIILLFPALFINLGLMPFILDEATRAIVALEMIFSGNYLVPTINGEFYYNKPPLFNWILISFVKLSGSYSEFIFRLPVVLSLTGFAASVYFTQKKELGREVAFIAALALITCGRILFYDSFKGLIDITFSWITYMAFWSVYYFHRNGKLLHLFMVSWLFTALGFLMKGLPSLVFQGITLLVVFAYTKQFKKLFSWESIAGGTLFLLIAGLYFIAYNHFNSLDNYWNALWSESAKRTAIDNSLLESVLHIISFPAEFVMHFLPWTFLLFFIIGKGRLTDLLSIPLNRFFIMVFMGNILIYWISPAIHPRYLFMFLPLAFGTGAYAYFKYGVGSRLDRIIWQPLMIVFSFLTPVALAIMPFTSRAEHFLKLWIPWLILLVSSGMITFLIIRLPRQRLYIFIMALLLSRVAFNVFVLPDRLMTGSENHQKNGAKEAALITMGEPLYLLRDCPVHHSSTFYIMRERGEILSVWNDEPIAGINYIIPLKDAGEMKNVDILHVFETRIDELKLAVIKIRD